MIFLFMGILACKDKDDCEEESFEGTPFFENQGATGGFSGQVSWPDSIESGRILEFGYETTDGTMYMGAVGDNLFDFATTCGNSMDYSITGVDMGSYRVLVRIQTSSTGLDTGEISYVAEGRSQEVSVFDSVLTDINVALEENP